LVRPLVEYASPVWDPYHQTEIDRIEMVQRRAARYVTSSHNNRSSVNQMLEHLEWKSLEQRRKDARLTMMYKITNEKVAIPKEGRLNTTQMTVEKHAQQKLPDTISSQRL
jgi:hypothetical protein